VVVPPEPSDLSGFVVGVPLYSIHVSALVAQVCILEGWFYCVAGIGWGGGGGIGGGGVASTFSVLGFGGPAARGGV